MRNQTALEDLSVKITLLLEQFSRVKDENVKLLEELKEIKVVVQSQKEKIVQLQEDEELRVMELEEISQKIANILS